MTEREFWIMLHQVDSQFPKGDEFSEIVDRMMTMLDHTDADDYFGTEGWRRDFGWES